MYILGINAYHGDASAAIVQDGKLIAAVEEERFNRVKHCAGFPEQSIRYCLAAAGIAPEDLDHVGISRDPSAHLHKKVLFAASRAAKGASAGAGLINQIKDRLGNAAKVRDLKSELARVLDVPKTRIRAQFHNVEHHRAHLASCFYVSPFERAALLSIDGFGDFISTMWAMGQGNEIEILGQVEYPHSIGIVYTATTQFLGFPHYGDEGKVMGLAPYGQPRFIEQFREIVRTEENGQFRLNLDYFRHHAEGVEMTWDGGSPVIGRIFSDRFAGAFGPPRAAGSTAERSRARHRGEFATPPRRSRLSRVEPSARANGTDRSWSRGRRGLQLGDERKDSAADTVSPRVRATGRGRQRHCDRRLLRDLQTRRTHAQRLYRSGVFK